MLNVLKDGPFRYIHCAATGELILSLAEHHGKFVETEGEDAPVYLTMREWKAIARKRIGDRLLTDYDNRN
jgi:hypothetical protein